MIFLTKILEDKEELMRLGRESIFRKERKKRLEELTSLCNGCLNCLSQNRKVFDADFDKFIDEKIKRIAVLFDEIQQINKAERIEKSSD